MQIKLYIGSEPADFNEAFNAMYSIGDIRDLGFGNNNTSYTLNLPLTKTNKRLLSFINQPDVKSEVSKVGRLYLNESLIIQGTIQVLSYSYYVAQIIINADDWIADLGLLNMTDLDFSAYNYAFTSANIIASWSASYPFYRYPMIDFGALASGQTGSTATLLANDFIPMFSLAQIITKIFSPFVIVSNWINSAWVKDLFILANEIIAADSFISNKALSVKGASASDNQHTEGVTSHQTKTSQFGLTTIRLITKIIDEGSDYNVSYGYYTIPESGTYRFTVTLIMVNTGQLTPFTENENQLSLTLTQSGSATRTLDSFTGDLINGATHILESGYCYFVAGDVIKVQMDGYSNAYNTSGTTANLTVGITTDSSMVNIWNNVNKYTGINQTVNISTMLPNMTQIDFVSAIRDMFNLRFWFDKSKQTLYIEPWDQFISSTIVDLTNSIDFDNIQTELISQYYNKTTSFKWKDDTSDQAYVEYLKTNTNPGEKDLTLNSLFTIPGIIVKESPFSSIITGYGMAIYECYVFIPRIWADVIGPNPTVFNRLTGFNTRIVHWDGLTSGFTWYMDSVAKTTYPKISPITWDYLYSNYLQKFYHYIDMGKLFTARMKINPIFLNQFYMVLNNAINEGFRPTYQIVINGIRNNFILQKVTTDGEEIEMELILKK